MGTWFKIKQISRHRWKGKIAICDQKFGSVKVTPNHSLLDVDNKLCAPEENKWLLNIRKLNYYNKSKMDRLKVFVAGRYEYDEDSIWLRSKFPGRNKTEMKRFLEGEDLSALWRFIGAYISEGSTSFNTASGAYVTSIANTDKAWLESLAVDLQKFFTGSFCFTKTTSGHGNKVCWNLVMSSKILFRFLKESCGSGSNNKKMPDWFIRLSDDNMKELFTKMIEGDGCVTKFKTCESFRYGTTSYKLACQFSLLLTTLGFDYTVNHVEHDNPKWADVWAFITCKSYQPNQGDDGKTIRFEDYDGYVYDISVDEVQNFAVGVGNIVVHNSHVKTSFDQPAATFDVNAVGVLNILEAVRQSSPQTKVYQACHDEETLAVTPNGFKKYADLKSGDLVYTMNEVSKVLEIKPIVEVLSYDYSGKMVELKGRRIDQLTTPNHEVMLLSEEDGDIVKSQAKDVSELLPSYSRSNYSIPFVTDSKNTHSLKTVKLSDIAENIFGDNRRVNLIDEIGAEDFCYILGLFIGDGYFATKKSAKVRYRRNKSYEMSRSNDGRFLKCDEPAIMDSSDKSS